MKKIMMYLEYDGTNFHGWQRQRNVRTVQETMEKALKELLKEEPLISGSSRTDAGVHARKYPVTFATESTIPGEKLAFALNPYLPEDVKVRESFEVPIEFDARKNARGKTYTYRLLQRKTPSALYRNYAAFVPQKLDLEKMREAAEVLLGSHDFSGFKSVGSTDPNPVKEMRRIEVWEEGEFVVLSFTASGFLYNMARILAGTLMDAGLSRISNEEIEEILLTGNRGKSMVMPPWGLYLEEVYYDKKDMDIKRG
jgi:tRNA pseudouridine38-40 synthase